MTTAASTRNGCERRKSSASTSATASSVASRTSSVLVACWITAGTTSSATTRTSSTSSVRGDGERSHDGRAEDTRGAYPRPGAELDLARLGAPCAGHEGGRDPREHDGDGGAERELVVEPGVDSSPIRLIAEIGIAWRASPRKPAPWSWVSNTRCAAIRIPITGPREPNSAARPTASAAPSAPEANVIAAPWAMSPPPGVAVPSASAKAAATSAASATARIDRTTTQAPPTRARNNAVRERPVAARSRKTPESMSCDPAVEPTIAAMMKPITERNSRLSLKPFRPPAASYLAGFPPCWMAVTR